MELTPLGNPERRCTYSYKGRIHLVYHILPGNVSVNIQGFAENRLPTLQEALYSKDVGAL